MALLPPLLRSLQPATSGSQDTSTAAPTSSTTLQRSGTSTTGLQSPGLQNAALPLASQTLGGSASPQTAAMNTLKKNMTSSSTPGAPSADPNAALKSQLGTSYVNPATVDTSKADATMKSQLANYQGTEDWTKNAALNALSNGQRAAGAASQLGGLAPGSASYLSNWRQATATGMRNLNDIMTNWQQGLSNIQGQQAANQLGVATTNAGYVQGANIVNAGRAGQLQDKTIDAATTQAANKSENDVNVILGNLKSAGVDLSGQHGATWAVGAPLYAAYQNAPAGSPQQAQALAALQAYANKVSAAKAAFTSGKTGDHSLVVINGKKYIPSSVDDLLKQLERDGYFQS